MTPYESSLSLAFTKIFAARGNKTVEALAGRAPENKEVVCLSGGAQAQASGAGENADATSMDRSLAAQFTCTACRDKGGYHHYSDGYRAWEWCPYCQPMEHDREAEARVQSILAEDRN
jgi:hypothetical protein